MLHANNLFWSVARHSKYNLDLQDYALPCETAGRVSKYVLSGDHLQLPPVPKNKIQSTREAARDARRQLGWT